MKVELPRYAARLREPALYKVLYGGRAGARSWTIARFFLLHAVSRPLRFLCVRELQKSMRDSVHRLLRDQIEMLELPGFTVTDSEIRHRNGSLFLFEGLRHNVTKVKSLEGIDRCWVEEAERVSERSWSVLIPTVIRNPGAEIWVSFNPYEKTDPTYQRFVVNPPPGAIVLKTSYRDNPWLSDEIRADIEHMRRVDPEAAAHIYDGECLSRSDSQVLAGKWCIDDFVPGADWKGPYQGADWGYAADPTVLVRLWIHERTLYAEHAVYGARVDISDTPALFDRVPDARRYMIRADNARPETISHMARAGFRIIAAPKWHGSVEDGVAHLRSYDRIVIHPRCTKLAEQARLWRFKLDELTGDVMPKLVDGNDDGWDAARYALSPMIKRRTVAVREVAW